MLRSVSLTALLVMPVAAHAQSDVHRVAPGETLWAIARQHYGAPTRWTEIYDANRAVVEDPDRIFPGEELLIPAVAPASDAVAERHAAPARHEPAAPPPASQVDASVSKAVPEHGLAAPETSSVPAFEPEAREMVRPGLSVDEDRRASAVSARAPAYVVRPGDEIETTFYTAAGKPIEAAAGSRMVDRDGSLFFPLVGNVQIEGMDGSAIRDELATRFAEFYEAPVITVNVSLKVNVTGLVGAPGRYLLDPASTVIDALSHAGGAGLDIEMGDRAGADLEKVQLVRDGRTILIDVRPEAASPETLALRVQSGDWIHVPPKPKSRLRDDVTLWSGVMSLVSSVAAIVAVVGR